MKWHQISIQEAEQLLESPELLLLDSRDYTAYLAGHHPRALHLSGNNLRSILKHTDRAVPVLIYCYHGHSSQDIAQLFSDFGFISCYSLEGGYEAWFQNITVPKKYLSADLIDWFDDHGFSTDNIDQLGSNNDTPLMVAVREGKFALAEELIAAGASLSRANQDGNNVLWMAVQSGSESMLRLLLRAGVNINQQNDHGATPLMLAMSLGAEKLVNILLFAGADWRLKTSDDFSAEDVAGNRRVLIALQQFCSQKANYAA
ncbi:MAG: ankyrin repeat domain-containing protein [Pseudomonas sp.]|nr:ankyrin repeat domain-containing protein [Pseudomonas sp.]